MNPNPPIHKEICKRKEHVKQLLEAGKVQDSGLGKSISFILNTIFEVLLNINENEKH
uniref:Uncharacterized protein n=1 Tax=Lepeophtheirus salmonis TaxID=72036 RepID=A0A0K2UIH8_LEPSM